MSNRRVSPEPRGFANDGERDYWQMSQDIAFRAGFAILQREGSTWAISDDGERHVCTPSNPEQLWFETWTTLAENYPRLTRLWGTRGPFKARLKRRGE